MKVDLRKEIELPEGTTVELVNSELKIKGPNGEAKRKFSHPKVTIVIENGKIVLTSPAATKREKSLLHTFVAHIKNLLAGVSEAHFYKVKICSGHFPMNVSVSGDEVIIKNFLGESVPRKVKVIEDTDIKVNGDVIEIKSVDKEKAGQMAARIESICRITNRDIRIFQDGCYIINKSGKDLLS